MLRREVSYNYCKKKFVDKQVLTDVRSLVDDPNYVPKTPEEFAGHFMYTCYMGSENSTTETNLRAAKLAAQLGR